MTRYPKSGKGRRWTIKELEAIPATWQGDTVSDGEGLSGDVRALADGGVSIRWRYSFRWESKLAWHQCGTWPTRALEAIRAERDRARGLVKDGVHPGDARKAAKIEAQQQVEAIIAEAARLDAHNKPVQAMYAAWLADGVSRADGNAELMRSFEKDVLPTIGHKPVKAVTEHDLRGLLRAMLKRGVERMTVRVYNDLVQLFTWAEERQPWRGLMTEGNPVKLLDIEKILPPGSAAEKPRERTLSADELRELRAILDGMENAYAAAPKGEKYSVTRPMKRETQLALWICLGTACRIGELLMARWEHVDLEAGEWFVPAENTKTKVAWRVYLSPFALRQFEALHAVTGETDFLFPAKPKGRQREGATPADAHVCVKTVSKLVGDRQSQFKQRSKPLAHRHHDNSLVLAEGKSGEWTPHDLRRTAATMMQALGVLPDIIDRCQNHVMAGSKVRRHYMHHEYADEKRAAWAKLGERLDIILTSSNVIPLPARSA